MRVGSGAAAPADPARHVEAEPRRGRLGFEQDRAAETSRPVRPAAGPQAARTAARPRSDRRARQKWWQARFGCGPGRRLAPACRVAARWPRGRGRSWRRPAGRGRRLRGRKTQRARSRAAQRAQPPPPGTGADDGHDGPARALVRRTRCPRCAVRTASDRTSSLASAEGMTERPRLASAWSCVPHPAATEAAWGKLTGHGARVVGQIEQALVIEPAGTGGADRLGDVRPAHPGQQVRHGAVGEHEVVYFSSLRPQRPFPAPLKAHGTSGLGTVKDSRLATAFRADQHISSHFTRI